jgi:hypothetical protein
MTRAEFEKDYTVENGRITSPGKFEGQMIYVPYFWDAYLNGMADRNDGTTLGFDIASEDREQFPELGMRRRTVRLQETGQGFVVEV